MTTEHREQWNDVCHPTLQRIERKIDHIDQWVNGNGVPGVKVRLDRIERSQTRTKGVLAAAWAAVVVLGAAAIGAIWK